MGLRHATRLLRRALLACAVLALPGVLPALAADGSAPVTHPPRHPHVTARPPLQVIPAGRAGAAAVQQRMRRCNAQADARKLRGAARETYVRSCMAARRPAPKPASNAAGEAQHRP